MKKVFAIVALVLTLVLALASCGAEETEPLVRTIPEETTTATDTATETAAAVVEVDGVTINVVDDGEGWLVVSSANEGLKFYNESDAWWFDYTPGNAVHTDNKLVKVNETIYYIYTYGEGANFKAYAHPVESAVVTEASTIVMSSSLTYGDTETIVIDGVEFTLTVVNRCDCYDNGAEDFDTYIDVKATKAFERWDDCGWYSSNSFRLFHEYSNFVGVNGKIYEIAYNIYEGELSVFYHFVGYIDSSAIA